MSRRVNARRKLKTRRIVIATNRRPSRHRTREVGRGGETILPHRGHSQTVHSTVGTERVFEIYENPAMPLPPDEFCRNIDLFAGRSFTAFEA